MQNPNMCMLVALSLAQLSSSYVLSSSTAVFSLYNLHASDIQEDIYKPRKYFSLQL